MSLTAGRDGGLQNLEVLGMVTLKITNEKVARVKVAMSNKDNKGAQIQVGGGCLLLTFVEQISEKSCSIVSLDLLLYVFLECV